MPRTSSRAAARRRRGEVLHWLALRSGPERWTLDWNGDILESGTDAGGAVVPVTPNGRLVGLGFPLCVKPGSFAVLAALRPDLEGASTFRRLGQPVRFIPPVGPRVAHSVAPALRLFPSHRRGEAPRVETMDAAQVLRGVVEAEAVIRDLTQAKLKAFARWVGGGPAFSLTYPDLATGLEQVRRLVAVSAGGPSCLPLRRRTRPSSSR